MNINRNDILGKKITEVIILQPDKPVTMSTYSYSEGYLEIEGGFILDLGSSVEPLKILNICEVKDKVRDTRYESEFKKVIGERIVDIQLPDLEGDDLYYVTIIVSTEKHRLFYSISQFWNRPVIEEKETMGPNQKVNVI